MIYTDIPVQAEGSAQDARMTIYIHEYTPKIVVDRRPTVLVLPGGGYEWKSEREAEPVVLQLLTMGCNAAVLWYSAEPTGFPVALREVGRAMEILHQRAAEWHIDEERIAVCGFSAGGHLAASYGVYWNHSEYAQDPAVERIYAPAGLILGYPVITSDERYSHKGSIQNLLGSDYGNPDAMDMVSLERHVGPQVPRTFIWNTATDNSVPAMNSILFTEALLAAGVSVELHMYDRGVHGLSLATRETAEPGTEREQAECASWISLLETWMRNL